MIEPRFCYWCGKTRYLMPRNAAEFLASFPNRIPQEGDILCEGVCGYCAEDPEYIEHLSRIARIERQKKESK